MDSALHYDEIELPKHAAGDSIFGKPEPATPPGKVAPLVFGQNEGRSAEQISSLKGLHETFARGLAHRASAELEMPIDVKLSSFDLVLLSELLERIPEASFLGAIGVQPLEVRGLVALDTAAALQLVDLLLGGEGKAKPSSRDLTEMEDLVLVSAIDMICGELQSVWKKRADLQFTVEGRRPRAQVSNLLPPKERVLLLTFEMTVLENPGMLLFGFPASVSAALLQDIPDQAAPRKHALAPDVIAARRQRLQNCIFQVEVRLPESPVSLEYLLHLEPGQVLRLEQPVEQSALVTIGDRRLFSARPVRALNMRGALIEADLTLLAQPPKEIV